MSWHWVGPGGGPLPRGTGVTIRSTIAWALVRNTALSAAVGAPVPPRALTMLSSRNVTNRGPRTTSTPLRVAVNPPLARASAAAFAAAAMSSGASPWRAGATRSWKMRGEFTIRACSGCANGTWMTSIRNSAEPGFESGGALEHPASSLGDRTGAEADAWRYTEAVSVGDVATVCAHAARQGCAA